MAFGSIKLSIKEIKNTAVENCFRPIMEKTKAKDSAFTQLQQELRKTDYKIQEIHTEIMTLEERVRTQEQYFSKYTIILNNLPISDSEKPLIRIVVQFFGKSHSSI